jgi:amidase
MARSVEDLALMMSVLSGPDDRSPIALDTPGTIFTSPLKRNFKGCRVAYSEDLGGLPLEPEVRTVMRAAREVFERIGCEVVDTEIDLSEAGEIFMLWRAWRTELRIAPLLASHKDQLKDTVIWNAEQGLDLTGPQLARAEAKRTEIYHRMREFMNTYEFFILPVNQVAPFSVDLDYPREINGVKMNTYIDWQKTAYFISAMGNPAISVPAGFTDSGLPVGVQIVGGHRQDLAVLQMAYAFEQATQFGLKRPSICTVA